MIPRSFEIAACVPGEPVHLVPEPDNPADAAAIMVMSARGVQIGYLAAERAPLIGSRMRTGIDVVAIFQASTKWGAWIRASFDGKAPDLPLRREVDDSPAIEEQDFWPDPEWPDE